MTNEQIKLEELNIEDIICQIKEDQHSQISEYLNVYLYEENNQIQQKITCHNHSGVIKDNKSYKIIDSKVISTFRFECGLCNYWRKFYWLDSENIRCMHCGEIFVVQIEKH